MNEISHAACYMRFKLDDFTGLCGAENFCGANGGEFQIFERRNSRITLRDGARELRRGFDEQHAGHDGITGEVAAQERFIAPQSEFAGAALTGVKRGQAIKEAELRPVWKRS